MKECVAKWLTAQVGDQQGLIQTLYDDYRGTVKNLVAQARADMAAGDYVALDRTVHALKGAALTVGDEEMLPAVLALRESARTGDFAGAVSATAQLDTLLEQL